MISWDKYKLVLFDFDDTIVDFRASAEAGFAKVCDYALIENTLEIRQHFKKINSTLWQKHNTGLIKREDVFELRFKEFFDEWGIQKNPQIANQVFLSGLPDRVVVYKSMFDLLKSLSSSKKLMIITNGHGPTQRTRIAKSGVSEFIDLILISDEVGSSKPDSKIFEMAYSSAKIEDPSQVLMIGDNLDADIHGGQKMGFDTCWISHGKTNPCNHIMPTYTVSDPNLI